MTFAGSMPACAAMAAAQRRLSPVIIQTDRPPARSATTCGRNEMSRPQIRSCGAGMTSGEGAQDKQVREQEYDNQEQEDKNQECQD
eukprot:SAG22_NODE_465_length_10181_cov_6.604444_5_plen_86_part_00